MEKSLKVAFIIALIFLAGSSGVQFVVEAKFQFDPSCKVAKDCDKLGYHCKCIKETCHCSAEFTTKSISEEGNP
ncbi:hypothetical protein D8674_035583 [Pyrus ussuriensis x Pyrus communis]|uniref:Uncharacterized protein n=1 Tax=Pyrus ussuriensis x Pyrus communis TaxID=2448454 RepID=A0A5N5GDM3_9ROSA|nr:hypothetical protein D8674_035583 [Pyrus ussuriensis x Pyrus communis]